MGRIRLFRLWRFVSAWACWSLLYFHNLTSSYLVSSYLIVCTLDVSYLAVLYFVVSYLSSIYLVVSHPILLSNAILSFYDLSCLITFHLISSNRIQSFLSSHVLTCRILPLSHVVSSSWKMSSILLCFLSAMTHQNTRGLYPWLYHRASVRWNTRRVDCKKQFQDQTTGCRLTRSPS